MSEGLFGVESVRRGEPAGVSAGRGRRGQPAKRFREFDPSQPLLLSPVLDEWLPERHLARFVADLVDGVLDLGPFYDSYTETRGFPPHDPRLMVRLLVYGYCTGIRSSRGIERRCVDDVAFRYLAAGQVPDFRSIAKFRRRHLDALAGLLLQTLRLAQEVGMVRLGRVALDGTKLRAAASKHKAMSYDRLLDREAQLETEVAALEAQITAMLAEAETVDAAEDARLGAGRRDDDVPGELARREARLAKLQAARASLEAEARDRARARAEAAARRRADRGGQAPDEAEVTQAGRAAAERARPEGKAQRNFTDPDSRIMKNGDGAFVQAYNGQAVVDETAQIVVAADVTSCASDVPSLTPMLDQAVSNTGRAPDQALVDAGYCSEENLTAAARRQTECGTDTLIATGRLRHGQPPPPSPEQLPRDATARERMASRLRTETGRADYARRKAIVEPVFGQVSTRQNGKQLLLRGETGARGEWRLLTGCHNIHKLFQKLGTVALLNPATA